MPSLKPYPAYADTDLPWLPKIPKHWEVKRAKWLFSDSIDKNHSDETLLSVTQGQGVVAREDAEMRVWNPGDDISGYKLVRPGEFVISLRSFEGGVEISNIRGIVSPAYVVLHPHHLEYNDYYRQLFKSRDFISTLNISTSGIRQGKNITFWDFRELSLPIPPLPEQRTIAAYLDRQTAKIDALIAKKQQLLDLLAEQRAALISQAVTKGLNPAAKMKDSGVEWLGQVPSHWEVKPLKYLAKIQTGLTLGQKYENIKLVTRPYLRVANVQDGYLDLTEITDIDIPLEKSLRHKLEKGDVLMTEGGDFDKLGRGYVWDGQISQCLHQNHIFAVRPNKEYLNSYFLAALMTSSHGKNYFTSTSQQTTNLASTNATKIKAFSVLLPPLSEQKEILNNLDKRSKRLTSLINKVETAIARLREYRAALISSVVTGKVDARQGIG